MTTVPVPISLGAVYEKLFDNPTTLELRAEREGFNRAPYSKQGYLTVYCKGENLGSHQLSLDLRGLEMTLQVCVDAEENLADEICGSIAAWVNENLLSDACIVVSLRKDIEWPNSFNGEHHEDRIFSYQLKGDRVKGLTMPERFRIRPSGLLRPERRVIFGAAKEMHNMVYHAERAQETLSKFDDQLAAYRKLVQDSGISELTI